MAQSRGYSYDARHTRADLASALAYYDGYRSAHLPANLLQAPADYFGAHTYERTDKPRGMFFHTNWTGRGEPRHQQLTMPSLKNVWQTLY